jgi:hypothetical protein
MRGHMNVKNYVYHPLKNKTKKPYKNSSESTVTSPRLDDRPSVLGMSKDFLLQDAPTISEYRTAELISDQSFSFSVNV